MLAALFTVAGGMSAAQANSKYSGIVVDAKTGRTLYENDADQQRYPASLTKMMTLYLLFDAMEAGKVSKTTPIPFSRNAASEPPTKLGIKPGGTVPAETAIYALVTRSANDVATALGEFLGGSEENFARMMTAKARQLGMTNTVFRNANGLPNAAQHTTARDMARLGMALHDNHTQYFHYFSTRSFTFRGSRIGNHNHLLGRIKGADGIKTGYINASGFNIVTTVSNGGRRLVVVVFGGRTARSRDDQVVSLVGTYLPKASTGADRFQVADNAPDSARFALATTRLPRRDAPTPTVRPRLASVTNAYAQETAPAAEKAIVAAVRPSEPVDPVQTAATSDESGWVIQVASAPSEAGAKAVLVNAARKAPTVLAEVSAYTEEFSLKGNTYYRARFSGFADKNEAWNTCGALKKRSIACYAIER